MDSLINCISTVVKSKGVSMETFINNSIHKNLEKMSNLGTSGNVVYPLKNKETTESGSDTYVPGLKDKLMLGHPYSDKIVSKSSEDFPIMESRKIPQAPVGWYMSEKFDGQRALWDGAKFVTRGSGSGFPRVYPYVPIWIVALMPPNVALDGEFFTERNSFQDIGFLRSKLKPEKERKKSDTTKMELDKKWNTIKFQVFDLIISEFISTDDPFEKRQKALEEIIKERCKLWDQMPFPPYLKKGKCPMIFTKQYLIDSEESLQKYYSELVSNEAEGVMIRAPHAPYIPRRTWLMLKLKPEEDSECIITGYKPGEGKYKGLLGAFECNENGKTFFISGISDSIRKDYLKTHPIGTKITYKYTFLTDSGIPRHPRYKGIPGDR